MICIFFFFFFFFYISSVLCVTCYAPLRNSSDDAMKCGPYAPAAVVYGGLKVSVAICSCPCCS
jgi:hypothetical protein